MRKTANRIFWAGLVALAVLSQGRPAAADNDQTVVIGFGFGIHVFSETDDFRRAEAPFLLEINAAGMSQLYGEWYLFEHFGFGARLISLNVTEEVISSFGGGTKEVAVSAPMVTVNWVPFGATSYARMGLLAGIGTAEYEATITFGGVSGSGTASGPATLFGIYLDWGAEDFGARFGANFLSTDLGDINGLAVDASGTAIYFDLRWAFE